MTKRQRCEGEPLETMRLNHETSGEVELKFGDEGAKYLAVVMKKNVVKELDLYGNSIGDPGAKALAGGLTKNKDLISLDLGVNNIGDEGAQSLGMALRQTSLESLVLHSNQIGKKGARSIAKSLSVCHLRELNLSANPLGDKGVQSIADLGLKGNTILEVLWLHKCQFGDPGAQSLSEALKGNTSLIYLDVSENKIGNDGGEFFLSALKVNYTIQVLDLYGEDQIENEIPSGIDDEILSEIEESLEFNRENPQEKEEMVFRLIFDSHWKIPLASLKGEETIPSLRKAVNVHFTWYSMTAKN